MKTILLATAITLAAGSAFAGALSDPIVAPEVIAVDTASSSGDDWVVPFMFLVMLIPMLVNTTTPQVTQVVTFQ